MKLRARDFSEPRDGTPNADSPAAAASILCWLKAPEPGYRIERC